MLDPKKLDEMAKKVSGLLPEQLQALKSDFETNTRLAMQQVLGRLDVVTREEFDVQSEVLAKTRARVEALEATVAELESQLREKS